MIVPSLEDGDESESGGESEEEKEKIKSDEVVLSFGFRVAIPEEGGFIANWQERGFTYKYVEEDDGTNLALNQEDGKSRVLVVYKWGRYVRHSVLFGELVTEQVEVNTDVVAVWKTAPSSVVFFSY